MSGHVGRVDSGATQHVSHANRVHSRGIDVGGLQGRGTSVNLQPIKREMVSSHIKRLVFAGAARTRGLFTSSRIGFNSEFGLTHEIEQNGDILRRKIQNPFVSLVLRTCKSVGDHALRVPPKVPNGVRLAPTTKIPCLRAFPTVIVDQIT